MHRRRASDVCEFRAIARDIARNTTRQGRAANRARARRRATVQIRYTCAAL
jgi:hypothetical protein